MKNNLNDELVLVDADDQIIGYADKYETHVQKLRHKAFSLFLYDPQTRKVMLHQRAMNKYHSGGLWTNSCCSHPRKGETLAQAVCRRAAQELGIVLEESQLHYAGKFMYFADYGKLAEYEIDNVVYAYVRDDLSLHCDPEEIMDIKWEDVETIKADLRGNPEIWSAWFPQAFALFEEAIRK